MVSFDLKEKGPGGNSAKGVPRIALLGWCDRAIEVTEGHPALWHTNLIGLSNTRVSHVYPLNLRNHKLAIAIYEPEVGGSYLLVFRRQDGEKVFDITVTASTAEVYDEKGKAEQVQGGIGVRGWVFHVVQFQFDAIVFEPGHYSGFYVDPEGESYIGSVMFLHASVPPYTPDEITALRSDPLALKLVRAEYRCITCGDALRCYTGLERNPKLEAEGWTLADVLNGRFTCRCGKAQFDLKYLRTGLHGLLRRRLTLPETLGSEMVGLYEQTALEEYCRKFKRLLEGNPREEEIQSFLQSHPVFFCGFNPMKLMFKRPVLSKYVVDFAILNERKELLLVEIEKANTPLVKKDGGIRAELQHAADQVRAWKQVFDEHRVAALECFGLRLGEVAKVRGIVVAGRRPKDEGTERLIRTIGWEEVDFFSYDDLISAVSQIIRQMASV